MKTEWLFLDKFAHLGASMFLVGLYLQVFRTWNLNPKWVKKTAKEQDKWQDLQFKKWCNSGDSMAALLANVGKEL